MPPLAQDTPNPAESSTFQQSDQLALRLFARVGDFRKAPPERALFRELIDLAIGTSNRFDVGGYEIGAAAVHHVGWTLYGRANAAGIIEEFSARTLAADARLGERAIRAALNLYRQWKVIRSTRPRGRRRPAEHRINLGGLDWPAVRKRAALERAENAQRPLDFDTANALVTTPVTTLENAESGRHDRTESGRHDRTQGLKEGLVRQESCTTAVQPYRARVTEQRQQQQQQDRRERRSDGLFAAIAARSRKLRYDYNEADERRRLAAGEIDVDDLQRRADELQQAIVEREAAHHRAAAEREAAREAMREAERRCAADPEDQRRIVEHKRRAAEGTAEALGLLPDGRGGWRRKAHHR